jgi:hypothetical protein
VELDEVADGVEGSVLGSNLQKGPGINLIGSVNKNDFVTGGMHRP